MYDTFTAISDIIVVVFDLLIYMQLTALRRDTRGTRLFMVGSCAVIVAAYFVGTNLLRLPVALSSFLFMSLPSFLIFWLLSRYKDARFFVTFCFVDTVTLILAFFSRLLGMLYGAWGAAAGCGLMLLLFSALYLLCRPYFSRYRSLLESVKDGWNIMMVATLLIYLLLVFVPSYPEPIRDRLEYLPVYALLSVTVLAFYAVFILNILQKKKLYDLNEQLEQEMQWHHIAYRDALTGLYNRRAYDEYIDELTRWPQSDAPTHAVMLDIDEFKRVNDDKGHHAGDAALQETAQMLREAFSGGAYEIYRIGGDEFAILAQDVTVEEIDQRIISLNAQPTLPCALSWGHAQVDPAQPDAIRAAFARADSQMYEYKKNKKECACDQ